MTNTRKRTRNSKTDADDGAYHEFLCDGLGNKECESCVKVFVPYRVLEDKKKQFLCGFCVTEQNNCLKEELRALRDQQSIYESELQKFREQLQLPSKDTSAVQPLREIVQQTKREIDDHERRKTNLIVNGTKFESESADLELLKKICSSLKVPVPVGAECKRVGKCDDDGKQRLLIDLKDEKWRLIGKSKELGKFEDFKNVYLNPDLTRDERMTQFRLRKELKDRRSKNPSKTFKIQKGKIIELN